MYIVYACVQVPRLAAAAMADMVVVAVDAYRLAGLLAGSGLPVPGRLVQTWRAPAWAFRLVGRLHRRGALLGSRAASGAVWRRALAVTVSYGPRSRIVAEVIVARGVVVSRPWARVGASAVCGLASCRARWPALAGRAGVACVCLLFTCTSSSAAVLACS